MILVLVVITKETKYFSIIQLHLVFKAVEGFRLFTQSLQHANFWATSSVPTSYTPIVNKYTIFGTI